MFKHRYAELEIRILARQDRGYPIEITCQGSEFPRGYGNPALLPWMPGPSQHADGERLFRWLLTDDRLQQAWAEARGRSAQRRVRLRIDVDAAELHSVPWELLCDASLDHAAQTLSADASTPFSRYLALSLPVPPPLTKRPIRVLAVIANPDDLRDAGVAPIDVAGERRIVLSGLKQSRARGVRVKLLEEPATLERVEAELKAGYDVLCIAAHGAFVDGKPWLLMADAANRVAPLADDELARLLARQAKPLRLVFLAACQSATHSTADAGGGLGYPDSGNMDKSSPVSIMEAEDPPQINLDRNTRYKCRILPDESVPDVAPLHPFVFMTAVRDCLRLDSWLLTP
jgi:hypothetical protein